ncbi:MAG: hypothetical protein ABSF43_04790 [Rectinemataceae bacterium]|jgi:hypothetical protein
MKLEDWELPSRHIDRDALDGQLQTPLFARPDLLGEVINITYPIQKWMKEKALGKAYT